MKRTFKLSAISCCFVFIHFFFVSRANAQYYRPPTLKWYHLKIPHFNIIFHNGEDSVAHAAARILEYEYPATQKFVGGHLNNFPVILTDYNDQANGFVTTNVFRMEVQIPSMKGKTLNPINGGWLENVLPHELTHALNLSVTPWPGVSGLLRPFSPDYARSMNYSALMGFLEGLAVYRESHVRPHYGGRGNFAPFYNQFYSNLMSPNNWNMGQLFSMAGVTRPFDRHYIGGYQFVNWLENNYGKNISKKIINFNSRWPFLGLGGAMWYQTGVYPLNLYNHFEKDKRKLEEAKIDSIKNAGKDPYKIISLPFKGTYVRHPEWIGKHKIMFYGSFYNKRPGFWIYNTQTNHISKFLETRMVENYWYDVNLKKHQFLYANYRENPFFNNDFKSDIYQVNLKTAKSKRLTTNKRVFSPVYDGKTIWALQTDYESDRWVKVNKNGSVHSYFSSLPNNIVSMAPNPTDTNLVAVVANRNGVQALWLVHSSDKKRVMEGKPNIAFKHASVFDPSWNSKGTKLLFTSDYGGVMNIYQYNLKRKSVTQITNTLFDAYEGSYSENGNKIAFVVQKDDQHKLALIKKSDFLDRYVDKNIWDANVSKRMNAPRLASNLIDSSKEWNAKPYHIGLRWIKPRTIVPYYYGNNTFTGNRFGIRLSSTDLLLKNHYSLDLSTSNNRIWYNASYQYTGFFPGFKITAFNQPLDSRKVIDHLGHKEVIGLEKRGLAFGVPIPITLKNNVKYSSIFIQPELKTYNERVITVSGNSLTKWYNRLSGNLYLSYEHNIQQDIQDAQPNGGQVFYAEGESDFSNHIMGKRKALRVGMYAFLSPLRRFNQSLKIGLSVQTQSSQPIFNTSDMISSGFKNNPLLNLNNVASLSTHYTIPVLNPDNGGFLLPFYIQQIYGVLFTDTAVNLDYRSFNNLYNHSRTIFGIGIHFVTGLSNLRINLGFGLAFEPTRNQLHGFATLQ